MGLVDSDQLAVTDVLSFFTRIQRYNSSGFVPYVIAIVKGVVIPGDVEMLRSILETHNQSLFFTYVVKFVCKGKLTVHDLANDATSVQLLVHSVGWSSFLHAKC